MNVSVDPLGTVACRTHERFIGRVVRHPYHFSIQPPPRRVPNSPLERGVRRGVVFHHEPVPSRCIVRVESRTDARHREVLREGQLTVVEDGLPLLTGAEVAELL